MVYPEFAANHETSGGLRTVGSGILKLPCKGGKEWVCPARLRQRLENDYPWLDLAKQFADMAAWLGSSSNLSPEGCESFALRWLSRQRKPTPAQTRRREELAFHEKLLALNERRMLSYAG